MPWDLSCSLSGLGFFGDQKVKGGGVFPHGWDLSSFPLDLSPSGRANPRSGSIRDPKGILTWIIPCAAINPEEKSYTGVGGQPQIQGWPWEWLEWDWECGAGVLIHALNPWEWMEWD